MKKISTLGIIGVVLAQMGVAQVANAWGVGNETPFGCPDQEAICAGDRVLYGNSIRTVIGVNNSGQVIFSSDVWHKATQAGIEHVSKIVSSHDGLKAGDWVVYKNSIRRIFAVDNTGRVVLESTARYRPYPENESGLITRSAARPS